MSVALNLDIRDYATPAIEAKLAKCSPARLVALVRSPLETFWRNRLRSLGTNKRGWPSTKFYERAARSVTGIAQGDALTLRADHQGLRQRWLGGPIKPVNADALTIPISSQAYGKTVADFPGAFLIRTRKGAYIVQYGNTVAATPRRRGSAAGRGSHLEFLFKLSKGVNQKGNPDVVPTNDELAEVAMAAIERGVK